MSPDIIQGAEVVSIPLECDDLKSGHVQLSMSERLSKLQSNIESASVSMNIDYRDTLAYVVFDGLSSSESFFMEALYASGKFLVCLWVVQPAVNSIFKIHGCMTERP